MIEIGRLVAKTAGRDAGKKAIVIDVLDGKYVLIDGETRRRKCNILHIEPLNQVVKVEKNASHDEVAKVLKEIGIEVRTTKPKPKTEKPKKRRKTPEQLRVQKEEKRKFRDFFKLRKKEEKAEVREPGSAQPFVEKKEENLEKKAELKIEEGKEETKLQEIKGVEESKTKLKKIRKKKEN